MRPPVDDAVDDAVDAVVWSVPMRTRFRGITVREGMLLRGQAGWGEFSPFLEYDAAVAEPWLRAARRSQVMRSNATRTTWAIGSTMAAGGRNTVCAYTIASGVNGLTRAFMKRSS